MIYIITGGALLGFFYMLTLSLCKTARGADSAIASSLLVMASERTNAVSAVAEPTIQMLSNVCENKGSAALAAY